jgi:hypothetical protein
MSENPTLGGLFFTSLQVFIESFFLSQLCYKIKNSSKTLLFSPFEIEQSNEKYNKPNHKDWSNARAVDDVNPDVDKDIHNQHDQQANKQ